MDSFMFIYKTVIISNPNYQSFNLTINELTNFKEICRQIKQAWHISPKELRIFNTNGIELFQDDLKYIPKNSKLWITLNGQDLDSNVIFNDYIILDKLDEKVLLCKHMENKTYSIIKVITGDQIQYTFRYSQILKQIIHKNIISIYLNILLPKECLIVSEYIQGGSLLELLNFKHFLNEQQAKIIIKQILDAIEYSHKKCIIHGNLKLENILFISKNNLQIKIVDFCTPNNSGSIPYQSPELIQEQIPTQYSDIWAIGVILYAMIFGTLPFQNKIELIQKAKFEILHKITPELQDLFQQFFIQRANIHDIINHKWFIDSHIIIPTLSLLKLQQINLQNHKKKQVQHSKRNISTDRDISIHGNCKPIKILLRSGRARSQLI